MSKVNKSRLLPVFLTFMIMGFVDIVGVSTGYVQQDFQLSDSMAQLLPALVFAWFFFFSIPFGILQDKLGKRKMMLFGLVITLLGLSIPFIVYSLGVVLAGFVLIGIGNTVIQVAAGPLLQEVSTPDKLSGFLSLSQFIKAITSLMGPIIATFMALNFGDWKLVLLVYAAMTLVSAVWLWVTPVLEQNNSGNSASFKSCFALLASPYMLRVVLVIFVIVGADVGMNSNIQGFLMRLHQLSIADASFGISLYFSALMVSRLSGLVLLQYVKSGKFLMVSCALALLGVVLLFFSPDASIAFASIFIVGLGAGNLFPLIFSMAISKMPERANEISGLLVMAIIGGAVIPPIMGLANSYFGIGSVLVLMGFCFVYVFQFAYSIRD